MEHVVSEIKDPLSEDIFFFEPQPEKYDSEKCKNYDWLLFKIQDTLKLDHHSKRICFYLEHGDISNFFKYDEVPKQKVVPLTFAETSGFSAEFSSNLLFFRNFIFSPTWIPKHAHYL